MTNEQKIIRYFRKCKTGRTQEQIAKGAGVNPNSVRRSLGLFGNAGSFYLFDDNQTFPIDRCKNDKNVWTYRLS